MTGDTGCGDQEGRRRTPIWARQSTRRASTLSREAIVDAAVEIADADGLEAVSIRRVATALAARTMSLYTYIESKDDLLDLMADQITGEVLIEGELPADWREAMTMIVEREREVTLRHSWIIDMINRRSHPVVGPNALRHLEQSMAAVAGLKLGMQDALKVIGALDDYTLGFVAREVREREIARLTGVDHLEAIRPYLQKMVDSGEFRNIAPLLRGDLKTTAADFRTGLGWLLDGIERAYS